LEIDYSVDVAVEHTRPNNCEALQKGEEEKKKKGEEKRRRNPRRPNQ